MALSRTAVDEGSQDQSPGVRTGSVLAGPRDFWQRSAMAKRVVLYAIALALAVAGLEWLEYRYVTRVFSTEIYIVLLATGFAGLGLWAGQRLTRRREPAPGFERNDAAVRSLGLTPRECEVLELLAAGRSTKEMARQLGISPNTAKTHLARIYEKLAVQRRTQAIHKARELALIP
ncbi:MAG TPA: response regulator transcription factor [Steroidobacteraceae bacterium]|nr:response regulator transcription factor [Steroidobacteraceae bacterium]